MLEKNNFLKDWFDNMKNIKKIFKMIFYSRNKSEIKLINFLKRKGSKIGDNVIIGAGSVVTGNLESNFVYAENPAKKIMTIDKFYTKNNYK